MQRQHSQPGTTRFTVSARLLALIVFAASAQAQLTQPFYEQLKDFLQLSDSQLQTILGHNDEYNRYADRQRRRMDQVHTELAAETAKETLDPMALGVRYAEIESICRDLKNQAVTSQQKNTSVLSNPQKAKLQVLQDAMKLAPVISQGLSANLFGTFTYPPSFFTGTYDGGIILQTLLTDTGIFGCYSYTPFPEDINPANQLSGGSSPATERKVRSSSGGGVFRAGSGVTTPVQLYQVQR